jgi:5'-deoxynucleotidase YfbR-like HD superfamily hydrolase
MNPRILLDVINIAARLKDTTRHCYTEKGRHESVAEHCWMTTLMALFMKDEFPEADMDKVIRMCIIHDLGEAFSGDIPVCGARRLLLHRCRGRQRLRLQVPERLLPSRQSRLKRTY